MPNKGNKPQKSNNGYQPFRKGFSPTNGNLDSSNPPKGGSGVPGKTTGQEKKKN